MSTLSKFNSTTKLKQVIVPLMPLGVEHAQTPVIVAAPVAVIVPLMLLGVEHVKPWINHQHGIASWIWESLFIVGFLLLMGNILGYFVMPRQRFRREPKYREEYFLSFSEQGIHFKTSYAESKLEWAMYNKLWIVPRHYLLFYGRDLFTIIPKRVFTGKEDKQRFEELVERKLSPAVIQIFSGSE